MPDATNLEVLLALLGDMTGLLELSEFRHGLLRALGAAVPADWISLNDVGAAPESTVVLIDPPFPPAAHRLYARYAHENPLLERYKSTGDGRAYRFSDVTTVERLRSTALHREFYATIGLEHQIAFTLPHQPDRVLALALSRRSGEPDFSDAERALLNSSRPFLIQIYRNAVEHSRLRSELERCLGETALPLADPRLAEQLKARGVTSREAQVLGLVATGASDREAAELMGLSERTVQKHLQRCYAKLGVHSREEAASAARRLTRDGG